MKKIQNNFLFPKNNHLELALILASLLVQLDDRVLFQVLVQLHGCRQALVEKVERWKSPDETMIKEALQ